jgi:endo-1,4-beta-xylanase
MISSFKIRIFPIAALLVVGLLGCAPKQIQEPALKDAFEPFFYIGTALNADQILGIDSLSVDVVKRQFNSITAENIMKSEVIQPVEGQFDFTLADKFIEFGEKNNMYIVGHTLIWHSQAPDWFFVDSEGKPVTRDVLIERMRTHIHTVVGRYKGRVHGWDVVNEAILNDGSWRQSPFYTIIGPEYVKLAFQFAAEADPNARLYYNDYNMSFPGKRQGVIAMVKDLQSQGVKIDGVNMQGHVNLDRPDINEFENSIIAFSELGVMVSISEFNITVLPWPTGELTAGVSLRLEGSPEMNPYPNGLPAEVEQLLYNRYHEFFTLFLKHHEKLNRVTLWGVYDGQSWRNYWPIAGRTDYPLLFDRQHQPKRVVHTLIQDALNLQQQ